MTQTIVWPPATCNAGNRASVFASGFAETRRTGSPPSSSSTPHKKRNGRKETTSVRLRENGIRTRVRTSVCIPTHHPLEPRQGPACVVLADSKNPRRTLPPEKRPDVGTSVMPPDRRAPFSHHGLAGRPACRFNMSPLFRPPTLPPCEDPEHFSSGLPFTEGRFRSTPRRSAEMLSLSRSGNSACRQVPGS